MPADHPRMVEPTSRPHKPARQPLLTDNPDYPHSKTAGQTYQQDLTGACAETGIQIYVLSLTGFSPQLAASGRLGVALSLVGG